MTNKEQEIIKEYDKVELTHPSLGEIVKRLKKRRIKVSKTLVHNTVRLYKAQNQAFGLNKN